MSPRIAVPTTGDALMEIALLDLARYYREMTRRVPRGLRVPPAGTTPPEQTKAWTLAELEFFGARLTAAGFQVERETVAKLRLPPDLVARHPNGELSVHVERETRGWEWNHVFGALTKLLFVHDAPAPTTVLVLDNLRGAGRRLELLLAVCRRLLRRAPTVHVLYLALWIDKGRDARVLRIPSAPHGPAGELDAAPAVQLLP